MGCTAACNFNCSPFYLSSQPSFPLQTTTNIYTHALFISYSSPSSSSSSSSFRCYNSHKPSVIHHAFNPIHSSPLSLTSPLHDYTNNNNNGGGGGGDDNNDDDDDSDNFFNSNGKNPFFHFIFTNQEDPCFTIYIRKHIYLFLVSSLSYYFICSSSVARAKTRNDDDDDKEEEIVFEIRGGKRAGLVPDYYKDEFVIPRGENMWSFFWSSNSGPKFGDLWMKCKDLATMLLLPEGFPESVTSDYLEYSLWRGVQGVAAQVSGVLATQALLYAVGLGKGAIPTAAAVNWVLKDGIGYLSKIMLSKFGRHFDVNPKGWRLFADLLENAAFGMEIMTPAFPHLFVPIGAAAGAGRSAAALIQAATRSCFYAGFAAQRNFAEVIAKGEAQGMVSKSIGIMLGIALANCVQSSTPLALASFGVVTWIHMFCNLKSYQSIQLRTLNPYRASLVFSQYLLSGLVPSVKEVNDEEPLFPAFPHLAVKRKSEEQAEALSTDAKDAASHIDRRLLLGIKLSNVVKSREDAVALFDLYKTEGYILTELEGRYSVVLKENSSPQDMLKSLFQVCYLYWLEKNAGIKPSNIVDDCRTGGRLEISLDYVQREFEHVKNDSEVAGWVVDGLIARPLPNRVRIGCQTAACPSVN